LRVQRKTLLREDFSKQRSKESDTTSGCDTGGSDPGTSLNSFNRSSSSSSQADTDNDVAHDDDKENVEDDDDDDDQEDTTISPYVDHGTLAGYSKVMNVNNDLGYINNLAPAPTNHPPKPPPTASPYIQLPAANVRTGAAPQSNGYIQIQNVPRPQLVLNNPVTSPSLPPPAQELVPHSAENPFYSKVAIVTDPSLGPNVPQTLEPPREALQAVKMSPGYIQFPSSSSPNNPVVISPDKLSDTSIVAALTSTRANEPPNTVV